MEALAALFAVLGHIFPVWLGFRGGKGVATGFGVFLVAAPVAALAAIGVFVCCSRSAAMSRWPPSSARLAFPSLPGFWSTASARPSLSPSSATVALLIIVKHHQNIRRLLAGTESRIGAKKTA